MKSFVIHEIKKKLKLSDVISLDGGFKYVLKSSNGTDTSQAAMLIVDHKTRKCFRMCRWIRKEKDSTTI